MAGGRHGGPLSLLFSGSTPQRLDSRKLTTTKEEAELLSLQIATGYRLAAL